MEWRSFTESIRAVPNSVPSWAPTGTSQPQFVAGIFVMSLTARFFAECMLWLPKTPYLLRQFRLRAFSGITLHLWRPGPERADHVKPVAAAAGIDSAIGL